MEPTKASEFKELEYWENFFKIRDGKPFEWYGEFPDFAELLAKHCGMAGYESLRILIPGCGNSELSACLYDVGFKHIVNIDFSKKVIAEMLKKHMRQRPEMKWRVMDMTDMKFSDAAFDVIIDKGGLDALLGDPGQETIQGTRFLVEVGRLLGDGGKYACITLGQSHVIEFMFSTLRHGWAISIHRVSQSSSDSGSKLQPFFVVAKKSVSVSCSLVSLSFDGTEGFFNYEEQISSLQKAVKRENLIRTMIIEAKDNPTSEASVLEDILPGQRVPKLLVGEGVSRSTYSCVVLDAPEDSKTCQYKCAVFLVPKGRRHEWLFSSEEGQWQVVESAKASRLIMVFLDTDFYSGSMEVIQNDLSPLVQELLPNNCKAGVSVPYLMCSDGVLKREILEEVESSLTGAILVENVVLMNENMDGSSHERYFRRLAFRRNPNMIQSEALLIKVARKSHRRSKAGGKGNKLVKTKADKDEVSINSDDFQVDHSYLASPYHAVMIAGLSLIASNLTNWISSHVLVRVAIVGLGAGLLPMFLHKHMPFGKIEVMELDSIIGGLAKRYFGFIEDERMKLHISDGLTVVEGRMKASDTNGHVSSNALNESKEDNLNTEGNLHVLIVDADSDDSSSGMSCPPMEFLEESFLSAARKRLCEGGMLVINLVARATAPHTTVPEKLKKVFAEVYSVEVDEDVNRVLFALPHPSGINNEEGILDSAGKLQQLALDFASWGSGPNIQELAVKLSRC
ncbi:hypothetical protein GOP47_0026556 [Adiantum capillus-veneris]|nr:hypothetical protein GOP47_0026556 [Adiantum capillus-veneris]